MHATRLQSQHHYYTVTPIEGIIDIYVVRLGNIIIAEHKGSTFLFNHADDCFEKVLPNVDRWTRLQSHDWTLAYQAAPPSSVIR